MRGDYWLFLAALILIVSLALQQVALALICLLFLLTGGVSRLWNRFCLHRIEYRRRLSHHQVFFGEEIVLEIERRLYEAMALISASPWNQRCLIHARTGLPVCSPIWHACRWPAAATCAGSSLRGRASSSPAR